MVRFVRSYPILPDEDNLQSLIHWEKIRALFYIPTAIILALGLLGKGGLMPFMLTYEWQLCLAASIYLTITNTYDAILCLQEVIRKGNEDQVFIASEQGLETVASLALATGSFTLGNAAILGLGGGGDAELWHRQCVLAFCLMGFGAAANIGNGSKQLLGLAHIVTSGCFLLVAILQVPSLGADVSIDANDGFRSHFLTGITATGAFTAVLSGVLNFIRVKNEMEQLQIESEQRKIWYKSQRHKKSSIYRDLIGKVTEAVRRKSKGFLFGRKETEQCRDSCSTHEPRLMTGEHRDISSSADYNSSSSATSIDKMESGILNEHSDDDKVESQSDSDDPSDFFPPGADVDENSQLDPMRKKNKSKKRPFKMAQSNTPNKFPDL